MMDEPGPYEVAVKARNAADSAGKTALEAEKDATKYSGLLGVLNVGGESATAMENAQKVLDAKTTIEGALKAAQDALADLEAAKEGASEEEIAELDSVITVVNGHITDIEAILEADGGGSLKDILEEVTGDDADDLKNAAYRGNVVAKKIHDAFARDLETGTDLPSTAVIDAIGEDAHTMENDQLGMTWSRIVGSSKIEMKRIADDDATKEVEAASADGRAVPIDDDDNAIVTCEDEGDCANGAQHKDENNADDHNWNGIVGTYFCNGDKCGIEGGKFTGGWYFTPTNEKTLYVDTDTGYEEDVFYTEFGYWLTEDDSADGDPVTVHTYARIAGGTVANEGRFDLDEDQTSQSATYSGSAVGMSIQGSGESAQSGHFDADVNLTVDFGEAADVRINGTISNFQGNAANPTWNVKLDKVLFNGTLTDGVTVTNSNNGVWTATSYAKENTARPTGIFGTFNANFTDGKAAGAYATRKDE
jgi:hypothetical protein